MLGSPFLKPSEKCLMSFIIPSRSQRACYFQAVLYGKSKLKSSWPLVVPQSSLWVLFPELEFAGGRARSQTVESTGCLPGYLMPTEPPVLLPVLRTRPQLLGKPRQKQFPSPLPLIVGSPGLLLKRPPQPPLTVNHLLVSWNLDMMGLHREG